MNEVQFKLTTIGEDDNHDYLVIVTMVDGVRLIDFQTYATDLSMVKKSLERPGTHFIFTCWCGDPMCAGLRYGVNVYHEGRIIRWRLPSPLPEQTLIFDRMAYQEAYHSCITKGKHHLTSRKYTNTTKPFSIVPQRNGSYFGVK